MTATLRVAVALFCLIAGAIEVSHRASAADPQLLPGTRVTLDLPPGSVVSRSGDQSVFLVQPLGMKIRIKEGGPELDELEHKMSKLSARAFRQGKLARSDTYFYFWWPGSTVDKTGRPIKDLASAEFHLVLSVKDQVTAIIVNVPRAAIDAGKINVRDIEDILATARLVPPAAGAEKSKP